MPCKYETNGGEGMFPYHCRKTVWQDPILAATATMGSGKQCSPEGYPGGDCYEAEQAADES